MDIRNGYIDFTHLKELDNDDLYRKPKLISNIPQDIDRFNTPRKYNQDSAYKDILRRLHDDGDIAWQSEYTPPDEYVYQSAYEHHGTADHRRYQIGSDGKYLLGMADRVCDVNSGKW